MFGKVSEILKHSKIEKANEDDLTSTFIEAMEKLDGVEHCLIILDRGDSFTMLCDKKGTISTANYLLDIAKKFLLEE